MTIYTYGEDSLVITVTPRIKRILKQCKEEGLGVNLAEDDLEYLVNSASKWATFKNYIKRDMAEVVVDAYEGKVDLKEVLRDLVVETDNLSVLNFKENYKEYWLDCQSTFIIGSTGSDAEEVLGELSSAKSRVLRLEKDFKAKGENVKVIGFFKSVEEEGIALHIQADSDLDELRRSYLESKKGKLDKMKQLMEQEVTKINALEKRYEH